MEESKTQAAPSPKIAALTIFTLKNHLIERLPLTFYST
jgi:hypothetical protein